MEDELSFNKDTFELRKLADSVSTRLLHEFLRCGCLSALDSAVKIKLEAKKEVPP